MYDYYLDPNAGLYGLRSGSEAVHAMYDPLEGNILIANNSFVPQHDNMLRITAYDMKGNSKILTQVLTYVEPTSIRKILSIQNHINELASKEGMFIAVQLLNLNQEIVSDNFYWLPDSMGNYSGLQLIKEAKITASAKKVSNTEIILTLSNKQNNPVSFFNRISLIDTHTKKRLLPSFYSDNYISVVPGGEKTITISYDQLKNAETVIEIEGWNTSKQTLDIK